VSTSRSSPSATILAGPFVLTGIGLALTIAGPLPVSRITWPNDDVMLARDPDAMPADSEATRPR
jgi:hypothetical protein